MFGGVADRSFPYGQAAWAAAEPTIESDPTPKSIFFSSVIVFSNLNLYFCFVQ